MIWASKKTVEQICKNVCGEIEILREEIKTQNNIISGLQKENTLLRDKISQLIQETELQKKVYSEGNEELSSYLAKAFADLANSAQNSKRQLDEMQNIVSDDRDYSKTIVRLTAKEVNKIIEADRINLTFQLKRTAAMQTANYILMNMPKTKKISKIEELWSYALGLVSLKGLYIEFGVYSGKSINYLSQDKKEETFYGFDSFEGLPEDWRTGFGKGTFKCDLPTVNENVILIKGYFNETLPAFVEEHPEDCSFIHVDCDLYSSTKVIFASLKHKIKSGTIILFDEYFNYPNWQQGEYKAFQEFVAENNVKYEYVAYRDVHQQVLVRILEIGN